MGVLNWLVSPISAAFGWGHKTPKDPYQALLDQLNPLIKAETDATTKSTAAGLENVGAAKNDLAYVSDWLKHTLTGSDDSLLKMFDTSSLTHNIDENVQQMSEQGVRGGRRAAVLGQSYFDRDASISKALQQLRFLAPDKIASIAGQIGQLGLGELGAGTNASSVASNNLFGIEQLRQADKDRKAAIIGSIFEGIGAIAGGFAARCVAKGSILYTINGFVNIEDSLGLHAISFNNNKEKITRKVIRVEISPNQSTKKIAVLYKEINATNTHVFYNENFKEVLCDSLTEGFELPIISDKDESITVYPVSLTNGTIEDVIIIKLENEDDSYPMIINGFICADDDPKKEFEVK